MVFDTDDDLAERQKANRELLKHSVTVNIVLTCDYSDKNRLVNVMWGNTAVGVWEPKEGLKCPLASQVGVSDRICELCVREYYTRRLEE